MNLQNHCADLFHFDIPWNPARLEQRNGRIDRKGQRAKEVFCRYFTYLNREEDRVLQTVMEKTGRIGAELGISGQVLEDRVELLARELLLKRAEGEEISRAFSHLSLDRRRREQLQQELESIERRGQELTEESARLEALLASLEAQAKDSSAPR